MIFSGKHMYMKINIIKTNKYKKISKSFSMLSKWQIIISNYYLLCYHAVV